MDLRHGRLLLDQWSRCLQKLNDNCCVSSPDKFDFDVRDKELVDRWTRFLAALERREVINFLLLVRCSGLS